jgi:hypothetical protein
MIEQAWHKADVSDHAGNVPPPIGSEQIDRMAIRQKVA